MPESTHYRIYVCGGPHCAARRENLLSAFESAVRIADLEERVTVLVGGCLSRCARGPNALVHPGAVAYAGLDAAAARRIVAEHLEAGSPVESYRDRATSH